MHSQEKPNRPVRAFLEIGCDVFSGRLRVIQALDVDARAERPDGRHHPQAEALSV